MAATGAIRVTNGTAASEYAGSQPLEFTDDSEAPRVARAPRLGRRRHADGVRHTHWRGQRIGSGWLLPDDRPVASPVHPVAGVAPAVVWPGILSAGTHRGRALGRLVRRSAVARARGTERTRRAGGGRKTRRRDRVFAGRRSHDRVGVHTWLGRIGRQ